MLVRVTSALALAERERERARARVFIQEGNRAPVSKAAHARNRVRHQSLPHRNQVHALEPELRTVGATVFIRSCQQNRWSETVACSMGARLMPCRSYNVGMVSSDPTVSGLVQVSALSSCAGYLPTCFQLPRTLTADSALMAPASPVAASHSCSACRILSPSTREQAPGQG